MRRHETLRMHLANEVVQHHFDGVEIGDYAILERANRDDAFRGFADHRLAVESDRKRAPGLLVDGDDRWLRDHDSFPRT